MSEIKHTPTPWQSDGFGIDLSPNSDEAATIWGPGSTPEGSVFVAAVSKSPGFEIAKENAEFICKAVNTYYEREALIKELKEAL